MNEKHDTPRVCSWCGKPAVEITDDHVIPRCLGGTRDLVLPSCKSCQEAISEAEGELIHKSPFALWRADTGPGPRNKGKQRSGRVEPRYILRPDNHPGGYAEVAIRATQEASDLVCFELNLETYKARRRARSNEEFGTLITRFKERFSDPPGPDGVVGEVDVVLMTKHDREIADDPNFWPRVFLGVDGRPRIRARNLIEAKRLASAILHLVHVGAFSRMGEMETFTVPAHTPMEVSLQWNQWEVLRVVTKMAVGFAMVTCGESAMTAGRLSELRSFILTGKHPEDGLPAHQLAEPGEIEEWSGHQAVVVYSAEGSLHGGVFLYGAMFHVALGPTVSSGSDWPAAASVTIDSRRYVRLGGEEAARMATFVQERYVDDQGEVDVREVDGG